MTDRAAASGSGATEIAGWPLGIGLHRLAIIDSTNAEAVRMAAAGHRGPLWITAQTQTAGRGRQGRVWTSPPGNLYATCLLNPEGPAAQVALLSFAAAVALHEALSTVAGPDLAGRLTLKWPNDLLLDGAKVAGILLESAGSTTADGGGVRHLAIGIGVNLAAAPDAVPDAVPDGGPDAVGGGAVPGGGRATALADVLGHAPAPEVVLAVLARALAHWQARLGADGFGPLRAAWLARAARLGQAIRARTGVREVHGIFETIDDTGALVLRMTSGARVAIPAAEVFF